MFTIEYYEDARGRKPAKEFIDGLERKLQAKAVGAMKALKEYGTNLRMPYSRHLDDGIFELRITQGGDAARILYFFFVGERVVITHGFMKKTQRTPRKEIKRAKRMRTEWEAKHGRS